MNTIIDAKEVKANKEHYCDFCNGVIRKGEKYNVSTHSYEGDIYNWKSHKHCDYLVDKLNIEDENGYGITMDDFIESVSEKHFDLLISQFSDEDIKKYSDAINQLTHVSFYYKRSYVLRYFLKQDKKQN